MVSIVEPVSASIAEGLGGAAWFNRWPADWPRRGEDPADRRPDPHPGTALVRIVEDDDLVVRAALAGVGPSDELYLTMPGPQVLEVWVARTQDGPASTASMASHRLLRVVPVPPPGAVADVDALYADGMMEIRIRGGARRLEGPAAEPHRGCVSRRAEGGG